VAAATVKPIVAVAVMLPDVPVTVKVAAPGAALEAAVNVRVEVAELAPAVNDAVTPVGRPDTVIATAPVKPFCDAPVRVLLTAPPAETVSVAGDTDRVNDGGGPMVRVIVVLAVKAPDVPAIVTVEVLLAAVLGATIVNTLLPAVLVGLKLAVTPLGRPDAASATVPVKPYCAFTATFAVPLVPDATFKAVGVADNVKLGGGVRVNARVVLAVRAPDVPVIVRVAAVDAAVLAAVRLKVLVVLVLLEPRTAVTPAGSPLTKRLTAELKPFCGLTVTVVAPLPPGPMVRVAGAAARVKLAGAGTVRESVVLAVRDPEAPVRVTVDVPGDALADAVKVAVLVWVVADTALKVAVTPAGNPAAVSATVPLNPFCGVTVIVLGALAPADIVRLAGAAVRAKVGGRAESVRAMAAVARRLPEVPVTVTVAAPSAAELDAVSVNVLVPVALAGLNDAVTPEGNPDAAKATVPLKPFCGVITIELEFVPPC